MGGNSGVRRDLARELDIAADQLFPTEYQAYGKSHLEANLRLITAIDRHTDYSETLTPFVVHKAGDSLRQNLLPELEPYSVNRGGFINQRLLPITSQLEKQNFIHTSTSRLDDFGRTIIRANNWVVDQLSVSDSLIRSVQNFFKKVDTRNFFQKHDKTRVYPRVTDESRYVAVDESLLHNLRTNSGLVDDPKLFELLQNRKKEMWETTCNKSLKPIILPTYIISKEFKNLFISDKVASLSTPTDPSYIERKLNIVPLKEQFGAELEGEVGWLNGMLVPNNMTVEDAIDGAWQFAEYPGGETIRVEFDGEFDFPEHQLYNYALGVVGPFKNRGGTPVMKAAGLIKNGELPPSLQATQTKALSRLQYQLDQSIIARQADIESCLRTILEEGDISKSDQWLLFDILNQIEQLETLYEMAEEIASHEQANRVIQLLAENLEHIQF